MCEQVRGQHRLDHAACSPRSGPPRRSEVKQARTTRRPALQNPWHPEADLRMTQTTTTRSWVLCMHPPRGITCDRIVTKRTLAPPWGALEFVPLPSWPHRAAGEGGFVKSRHRSPNGEQRYRMALEAASEVGIFLGMAAQLLTLKGNATWGVGLQVASVILLSAVRLASAVR